MQASSEPARPSEIEETDSPALPLLAADSVVKRFGGVAAVDGVSFTLRRGEILGLIGPNGAGKTTLFDCLAGSQAPTSGRILLSGRPVERLPAHRRLAAGLGRTFQIPRPFPQMSLMENVLLGSQGLEGEHILPNWLTPGRVARAEAQARRRAMDLLDFVTLKKLANEPARVLSGGQRKLLELARVLMADPAIILLDEPAAGVNPSLLEVIIARIAELNRRRTTFLLIEHNMDLVARLCGRVLVLASGRLLTEGRPDAVSRDPRVIEAYLGGVAA
jgi:branched-chain amino acid transport system ATP-binding protein